MPRSVSEALRGPVEDRKVTISRLKAKVEYPASFMLVMASNPCPCGYWGVGDRCTCTAMQRLNYISKLSGPMMDRIDIQLSVPSLSSPELARLKAEHVKAEPSSAVARRVAAARERQRRRFSGEGIYSNAEMGNRQVERFCRLDGDCQELLVSLMDKLGLSMRAYFRIIKVARTIADLEGNPDIRPAHISEAACYRFLDRTPRVKF